MTDKKLKFEIVLATVSLETGMILNYYPLGRFETVPQADEALADGYGILEDSNFGPLLTRNPPDKQ